MNLSLREWVAWKLQTSRDLTSISTFTPKVSALLNSVPVCAVLVTRATEQESRTFERRSCANAVQENCLRAPRPSSRLGGNPTPSGLIPRYEIYIALQYMQLHNISNHLTYIPSLLDHTNSNANACKTSKVPAYCICHYQECGLDPP